MRYLDTYKIRARGDDTLADYVKGTVHRIGEVENKGKLR